MLFKDKNFANSVKQQLCELSSRISIKIKPLFPSRKICEDLKMTECKPRIVNQQCVVYKFKCNVCYAWCIGYTCGHLYERVVGHKRESSSIYRHYKSKHKSRIPEKLLDHFHVLEKCSNKFDCLTKELLFVGQQKPELNVQSDSITAKVLI